MTVTASVEEVCDNGDMRAAFAHVDTWVFDLDDTLYPRSRGVHELLRKRVVSFVAEHVKIDVASAEALHLDYYERFGSTLQGMVELHGVRPAAFLDYVHDIDLSMLAPDTALIAALKALSGRKIVFTNASRSHAVAALAAMGMAGLFDFTASIEDSGFVGKPHQSAFDGFIERYVVAPGRATMFEDRPNNLRVPHLIGMRTVLVSDPLLPPGPPSGMTKPAHIDFVATNLAAFVRELGNLDVSAR